MKKVLIIDTSIFCVYLGVPGKETCGSKGNKWNKIQQLSLRISRWYESLVYYQYVEYINNYSSNIFSDSYFESFDVLKF